MSDDQKNKKISQARKVVLDYINSAKNIEKEDDEQKTENRKQKTEKEINK